MANCTNYTHHHVAVFLLTFLSYAFFHATRKTFSNVKSTISDEWSPSFHNDTVNYTKPDHIWNSRHLFNSRKDAEPYLGVLDAVFMISYAVGLYISGMIGDRLNMRLVLSFGMCSSAVMVFVFGVVFEWAALLQQVCLRHHLDPERSPSVHGVADGGRYHGELVWSTQPGSGAGYMECVCVGR
eukprot:XP_019920094.1 PREDICTED: sugar phosphate exchanger 3-like [Crassostrea gigas]